MFDSTNPPENEIITLSPDLLTGEVLINFGIAFAVYCERLKNKVGIGRFQQHMENRSQFLQEGATHMWEGALRDANLWPEADLNERSEADASETEETTTSGAPDIV